MDKAVTEVLIWTRDWDSADELREALARWLEIDHRQRPHQALGGKTPSEKRAENLKQQLTIAA